MANNFFHLFQEHLCGVGVIYPDWMPSNSKAMRPERDPPDPTQGGKSRINRQKRDIANRVEVMRLNAKNRCLVFVLTCPVDSSIKTQNENISKFFNTFCKSHKWGFCNSYVWVREYQKNGRPHWHCIADVPKFPIRKVNDYWSQLWQSDSRNSFRMHRGATRFLAKNSNRLCWYLTKYFVKNFAPDTKPYEDRARKFGSSQELVEAAKPKVSLALDRLEHIKESYNIIPLGHETFMCVPKSWNIKPKKIDRDQPEKVEIQQRNTDFLREMNRARFEDLLFSKILN